VALFVDIVLAGDDRPAEHGHVDAGRVVPARTISTNRATS